MRTDRTTAATIGLLLFVFSATAITANPASRAEITPPATEAEPAVTTERITTTAAAAPVITTLPSAAQETTQDISPTSASQPENRTEPPAMATQETAAASPATPTPAPEGNKEPSQGLVSFDQRQHGRFNIRADLDNFMIILLPQSTTKSPLLNLGALGGGSMGGGGGSFGSVPGSSLLDLFTRKAPTKRPSRRKYKVKSASYKRKYKEMLRRQALAEEKEGNELIEADPVPSAANAVKVHEEPQLKKVEAASEVEPLAKEEVEERTSGSAGAAEVPIHHKYRMDTLEKIQHQLDILIKRVDAREANFERHSQANMEHFVEGRTPYRVEIGSLTNEADILPSAQHPIPFRQFRTDRPLEIGSHGPQPKFFQPWAFPGSPANPADNPMNPFAQRGPVMVAFRDGRSLGPRPEGNELRSNSILALPLNSLGFMRAMEMESNDASHSSYSASSPSSSSTPNSDSDSDTSAPPTITSFASLPQLTGTTTVQDSSAGGGGSEPENPFLNVGFVDLTDTLHSFDSLNVDNVDKIDTPTQTAQFNRDWDLKLLGATDDCGPDRRRDSYGVCQFIQF